MTDHNETEQSNNTRPETDLERRHREAHERWINAETRDQSDKAQEEIRKLLSETDICLICKQAIGNRVFTICDECWEKEHPKHVEAATSELERLRAEVERLKSRISAINGQRNVMANAFNSQNAEAFWSADTAIDKIVGGQADHAIGANFHAFNQIQSDNAALKLRVSELESVKIQACTDEVKRVLGDISDKDARIASLEAQVETAKGAMEVAQLWLCNCIPTVELEGPAPLPLIRSAIERIEKGD